MRASGDEIRCGSMLVHQKGRKLNVIYSTSANADSIRPRCDPTVARRGWFPHSFPTGKGRLSEPWPITFAVLELVFLCLSQRPTPDYPHVTRVLFLLQRQEVIQEQSLLSDTVQWPGRRRADPVFHFWA